MVDIQDEESERKITNCPQKAADIENADSFSKTRVETIKAQVTEAIEEVKIFRVMVKNYFPEDSDKETDTITRYEDIEWDEWEDNDEIIEEVEYKEQANNENEELTNLEQSHQKLLEELVLETGRIITWSTTQEYWEECINKDFYSNKAQPIDIDEVYLINIPIWEESVKGVEFENEDYDNTSYDFYNTYIDANHYG
ncbi:3342_t:CDS:2 [Dentiscutata erythropus]|uniref:3342_t:CDS:1 n=1 Tax=Dentiscutata erythropus TaxID=1348616 RepID=A0A9N8VXQ2_9GLOM|nr:3342_t:CDS:2 [Dentiscutata erythropus]